MGIRHIFLMVLTTAISTCAADLTFQKCTSNTDIILVLDSSSSIGDADWKTMLTFVQKLVDKLVGDSVYLGIILFSNDADDVVELQAVIDLEKMKLAIEKLPYLKGKTNSQAGLVLAKKLIDGSPKVREKVEKYVIFISDGESNKNSLNTIPAANELKTVADIVSVGVGNATQKGTEGFTELEAISTGKAVVSVKNFDALSDATVTEICQNFEIVDGKPCPEGHTDAVKGCILYKCQKRQGGSFWTMFYTGCPYEDRCLKWGEELKKPNDCNLYKCTPKNCAPGKQLCPKGGIEIFKVGCSYKNDCLLEGEIDEEPANCKAVTCARTNTQSGPQGETIKSSTGCELNGKCYPHGYKNTKKCLTTECSPSGLFFEVSRACFVKDNKPCLQEGESIEEDCIVYKCVFDNKIEDIDIITTLKRCSDNGCHDVGSEWQNEEKCLRMNCELNDEGKPTVKRTVTGCRREQDSECTPIAGIVKRVNNTCVEYECQPNQKFVLKKAECIDDDKVCHVAGDVWRPDGLCQENICQVYEESNKVKTKIVVRLDCMIQGECVFRGKTLTKKCVTTRCNENGEKVEVKRDCPYKKRCVAVNEKKFVDPVECKEVDCLPGVKGKNGGRPQIQVTDYGCFHNDVCIDPNAKRQDSNSCMIRQCNGVDHTMYPIVCMIGNECINPGEWRFDMNDCVNETCVMDDVPPGAFLRDAGTGCVFKGSCFKPGDIRGDCVEKECVGDDKWKTNKAECKLSNGTCVEIGKKWFDETKCEHVTCSSRNNGNNAVITTELHGCEVREDCLRHGEQVENNENVCTKFKCEDGKLISLRIACDLPDLPINQKCLDEGKSLKVEEVCTEFDCKEISRTDTSIELELTEQPGCVDGDKCYYYEETKELLCETRRCKKDSDDRLGLLLDSLKGCTDENGLCKAFGAEWDNELTCMKRKCLPNGKIKDIPIGCLDPNDNNKCVRFNNEMDPGNTKCIKYLCKNENGKPMRITELTGCPYGDECKAFDSNWPNLEKCVSEICTLLNGKPSITNVPYGCISAIDHQCRPFGYNETEPNNKCVVYECQTSRRFAVKKARCSDGRCYKVGDTWGKPDSCTEYTCLKENMADSYRVTMINQAEDGCVDFEGKCIRPGETARPGNCTEYVCDGETASLSLIDIQCQTETGCKKAGETWFVDGNCTEYKCTKVSATKLKISEITRGCKAKGGKCFESGEEKKEICNVFECDGESRDFMPIVKRCSKDGKCYNIDFSWTSESCVTFTCKLIESGPNVVKTEIEEVQGCKHKQQCYNAGNTRTKGCSTLKCQEDGSWKKTVVECKAEDGSCFAPGENYTSGDCTVYGCDPSTGSQIPLEHGCVKDGKCVKVGTTWKNEAQCKWFKCEYDEETGEANPEVTNIGCVNGKTCIPPGTPQDDECTVIKCINGQLKIRKIGCEWKIGGGCLKVGQSREHGCVWYTCTIENKTPTEITTSLKPVHGCKDCNGNCIEPNAVVKHGCITQKCEKGGKLVTTDIKCLNTYTKKCVKVGSIIAYGNVKKRCTAHGSFQVIPLPTHCTDAYGNKVGPGGTYLNKKTCKIMQCIINYYDAVWNIISRGCKYQDECHEMGQSWFDFKRCKEFRCINKRFKRKSEAFPSIEGYSGCRSKTGTCYKVGQQWKEDCTTKQCQRYRQTSARPVIIFEGCTGLGDKKCHKIGDKWVEKYRGKCIQFECRKRGRRYRPIKIGEVCLDRYGVCRQVGDYFFDCELRGKLYHGCLCEAGQGKARVTCPGGY